MDYDAAVVSSLLSCATPCLSMMSSPNNNNNNNNNNNIHINTGSLSIARRQRGPPCKVCGDESSGVHYGVDSCEGCKGFFRRCFVQGTVAYRCAGYERCDITPFSRNSCQFCRLQKCFAVGMSRHASRLGRRPKRRNCETAVVHQFNQQQQQRLQFSPDNNTASLASQHDINLAHIQALVKSLACMTSPLMTSPTGYVEDRPAAAAAAAVVAGQLTQQQQSAFHEVSENVSNDEQFLLQTADRSDGEPAAAVASDVNSSHVGELSASLREQLARQVALCPSRDSADVLAHILRTVVDAHLSTCLYTSERVAIGALHYDALMTDKPPGWDLEQIRKKLNSSDPCQWWQQFVDNMAPVIKRVVAFCRKLPGFLELCQDDQITLIKRGSFEVILARYTTLFTDQGMFVPDMTARIPRHLVKLMPMGDFFEEQFKFADVFNVLRLTDSELAVLTGIMILNPDRDGLLDNQTIYKLRGLYLQCLYALIKSSRPDEYDERFRRIISTLPQLNHINNIHTKKLNSVKMTSPNIHFPDLHDEVFNAN